MLLRLLLLYVVYFATGGRGKTASRLKKGSSSAHRGHHHFAHGKEAPDSFHQDHFKAAYGRAPLKAFEVLQDDIAAISAAAGTTVNGELGEVPVNESEQNWGLYRVAITATAAVTGNNSNSGTINIRQMRAGAAVATVASLALVTGTNLAAEVPTVIPISGSPVLVAGDVLDVQYVQIGTGLALPLSTVKAEIA